jgi:hypothetical protein
LALSACTSSPGPADAGAACPSDLPDACLAAPSYDADIAPLIARRCLDCHGDGGVEHTNFDLTTYKSVFDLRTSVLTQVYGCLMPPGDAAALESTERADMLEWLVCHAPNN